MFAWARQPRRWLPATLVLGFINPLPLIAHAQSELRAVLTTPLERPALLLPPEPPKSNPSPFDEASGQTGASGTVPTQVFTPFNATASPLANAANLPTGPVTGSIATPQLVAWLTAMVHDNLPPSYEDNRKWGQQKEVWDGVKFWREDGHLETKRRTKLVNSGTWTRYSMAVVEPDKNLHVEFNRLETLPDGRIAFEVTVECPLDVFGRLSQWTRDVQIVSISANADAACRLKLDGTVQFQMNLLKLPPDISIKPHVDHAHIELTHYRVRRISQVGGDFAKLLGNSLRGVVDDKLADMNGKLAEKINKQIDKNSQRLSFSTQDWIRSKFPLPPN